MREVLFWKTGSMMDFPSSVIYEFATNHQFIFNFFYKGQEGHKLSEDKPEVRGMLRCQLFIHGPTWQIPSLSTAYINKSNSFHSTFPILIYAVLFTFIQWMGQTVHPNLINSKYKRACSLIIFFRWLFLLLGPFVTNTAMLIFISCNMHSFQESNNIDKANIHAYFPHNFILTRTFWGSDQANS